MALEEVKFLQKQRQRKSGIPAVVGGESASDIKIGIGSGSKKAADDAQSHHHQYQSNSKTPADPSDADKDKDDLVLQDTFAQETAVMVEDPNMYAHLFFFFIYFLS